MLLAAMLAATPAISAPPVGAAPIIGDFAYDHGLHAAGAGLDPLPIETSEDFEWMVHDARPPRDPDRPLTTGQRLGQTAPFRMARKLGADEVIVPVWTLHL